MDLREIRSRIDAVDSDILKLFLKRLELAGEVAACKKEQGLPILNREREREILASVMEKAGENDHHAYELFQMLFAISKAKQSQLIGEASPVRARIEKAMRSAEEVFPHKGVVACQGTEGSNSQAACDKLLPMGKIVYFKTFEAVFDAVDSGLCQYGVLPIENSSFGSVRAVYALLQKKRFFIVRGTRLHIRHELLAKKGAKLTDIREIYSHEQALGQCSKFIASMPEAKGISASNTAIAAKLVAEMPGNTAAAIASHDCAALYGLEVIREEIQDNDNNYTNFICIAKEPVIYAGANRISLMLVSGNAPGDLNHVLTQIAARGINMCKLESCPIQGRSSEFAFFIDLEASVYEPGVISLLEELQRMCRSFVLLGSYAVV